MKPEFKILFAASEAAPFAKSGGLGDVAGSLPRALGALGADVRIVLPKYKNISGGLLENAKYLGSFPVKLGWRRQEAEIYEVFDEVRYYFIGNDYYFGRDEYYGYDDDGERFAFFCKAVLDMIPFIDFYPDIIHANDWQTGALPLILKTSYSGFLHLAEIKTLYTIHNLQYQGSFPLSVKEFFDIEDTTGSEFYGSFNFMKCGIYYSDAVSTVSPTYAKEIQTAEYGYGLEGLLSLRGSSLKGILNGISFEENDPETDPAIYAAGLENGSKAFKKANKEALLKQLGLPVSDAPLFAIVSRLANQKGMDILPCAIDTLVKRGARLVVLGTGEKRYEEMFEGYRNFFKESVSANIMFDDGLARRIYAGSDIFLMPSRFEPCGLGQMLALRYGTIPIGRKTGGLSDTIVPFSPESKNGNGFLFEDYSPFALRDIIDYAMDIYENDRKSWASLVDNALESDCSWKSSAKSYLLLYKDLIK